MWLSFQLSEGKVDSQYTTRHLVCVLTDIVNKVARGHYCDIFKMVYFHSDLNNDLSLCFCFNIVKIGRASCRERV